MANRPECPNCGAPRAAQYRPFCSKRCAEADLGRWFSGVYTVPADDPPEGYEDDAPPPREPANDDDEY